MHDSEANEDQCQICGDQPIGYNFGIITCDSCRSFFRRTSKSDKTPKCPFNNNCVITKESRKHCQGCRLQKCLAVGMQTEECPAKKRSINSKLDKALSPKKKKSQEEDKSPANESNFAQSPNCTCECKCGYNTHNIPTPLSSYSPNNQLEASPSNYKQEYQLSPNYFYNNSPKTQPPFNVHNLTPSHMTSEQQQLLNELTDANGVLKAPMELTLQTLENPNELSLMTVVRISDLAMRRIIAMVKKLNLFKEISHFDQLALLKGSLSELLIIRGVMVFDPSKDAWCHHIHSGSQQIRLSVDVLKKTPEEEHYEAHKRFLTGFDEQWRQNECVMLIMNAIILFSPDRPNIQDMYKVEQVHRHYVDLLKNYLDSTCSDSQTSSQSYTYLMSKLRELKALNQSLQRIYSRLNPDDLEPLLKELFASSA